MEIGGREQRDASRNAKTAGTWPSATDERNLASNPAVCVHLESGNDVVIREGDALQEYPDRELAVRLSAESAEKYEYAPKPEDYARIGVHVFRPRVAFAWRHFPKDAPRWHWPNP